MEWAPRFADKWERILLQLMPDESHLISSIRRDTNGCEDCCQKMFEQWCDLYSDRTWNDIIKALRARSVRKNAVAEEIYKQLG